MTGILRLRTMIGAGISVAVFMVWGFLLGAVLFPMVRLMSRRRARRIFHGQVRLSWRIFCRIMEIIGAFSKIRVTGLHHIPEGRACMLVCNHLTLVDIVALGSQVPNFNCVIRMNLWRHPFFGSVVRACDFIPNVGSDAFIEQCKQSFEERRPLIIFPQGERTRPEMPLKFQRGAAQIAVRLDVDVLPVIIDCTPLTMAKGMHWYNSPASPVLTLSIQPPLAVPKIITSDMPTPLKVRALTRYWEEYYISKIGA
ncbi:MAG: 1-acyl-sn-glycerol-3-phosphate acyltransferase [Deltaproteobacteria bacterium]|nr:1-acyl-sn-glycerol-3-phosphate acyltransferase [Deltaproteobacteria bacterium]